MFLFASGVQVVAQVVRLNLAARLLPDFYSTGKWHSTSTRLLLGFYSAFTRQVNGTRLLLDFYSASTRQVNGIRLLLDFYSTGKWLQQFLLSKFTCRPVDSTSTRLCSIGQKCETVAKNGYSTGDMMISETNSTRLCFGYSALL